jgi:FkbM family methyltransferase
MLGIFKQGLIRLLESRGYCVSFGEPATIGGILGAFSSKRDNFFFVQIGAYDGRECDPIHAFVHRRRWKGILVEPQPDAFERLRRNYAGGPDLIFENVAIADREGSLPLYRLRDEFAHLFKGDHRMMSSFDPEHVIKHLTKQVDPRDALQSIQVRCLTLSGLLAKYGVHKLDLLQIDAEGCDYQILKMVDFGNIKPKIICFEHVHLGAIEKGECIQLLVSQNYKVVTGCSDMSSFQSRWMHQ